MRDFFSSRLQRLRCSESGFALIELMVALLLFSIVMGMATELYISNLRSTSSLNTRAAFLDEADFVKSWLTSNLAVADIPPVAGTWQELEVTSNSECFRLSLNTGTNSLEARSVNNTDCDGISEATPEVIGENIANTEGVPLFTYKNKSGGEATDISNAREINVNLRLDDPTDSLPAVTRTFTYALGGVYLANQVAPNSIGTAELIDGSVTSSKIANGAVTGDKLSSDSIGAEKLSSAVRTSGVRIPLISGGSATWSAASATSWSADPQATFDRVSSAEADYCQTGKSLQARAHFVVYNQTAADISLLMKLVRDDGQGSTPEDFAVSDAAAVNAHSYKDITSDWQDIDCEVPDTGAYFYSGKTEAGNGDSVSKDFAVVYGALELRYQ